MSRHILILVENLSVPFDRRVWQESSAFVEITASAEASVSRSSSLVAQ